MNQRQRWRATLNGETVDRLPFVEFMGYWPETIDRWHREGLPARVSPAAYQLGGERHRVQGDWIDPREYFGLDRVDPLPVDFNPLPAFERVVLSEDEHTRVVRDERGLTKKEFKTGSAMPHFIDFPIKDRASFDAFRDRMDPASPGRYPADWTARVEADPGRDHPVYLVGPGPFAFCRDTMPFERLMMAFVTEPDLVADMMAFATDFLMALWRKALAEVEVDFVYLGEDMAYKNAPMISPAMADAFLVPNYRRLVAFLNQHGVEHIIVDSDGDIRPLIGLMEQAGITGVLPMEYAAGCDAVEVRSRHPSLQMIGGLNKLALAAGPEAIDAELERIRPILRNGGRFIPSFDHSVPPIISLEHYRYYLGRLGEMLGGA